MTILGKVIGGPSPASIALKGTELILDADADTTITADTDDRIDIKIAGADDFKFTANNFNVLSGSTLTIDSGATITNSGTANNFGTDPESAYAGVLQTNANFIDQVIFGPAVDGRAWNGLWNKASVFSSLMLATIEDEGSNTEINIWDLTEQSAGTISTTPLATVDLSAAATPTSVAACMGYLIVGSEDGMAIIDPHSGAWAERTDGWPRTLSTSTIPALTNNDVQRVAAGLSDMPPIDHRTGGPLPTFAVNYGTGADTVSVIKDDGNVYDRTGTVDASANGVQIVDGYVYRPWNNVGDIVRSTAKISAITADDWGDRNFAQVAQVGLMFGNSGGFSIKSQLGGAAADTDGLTFFMQNNNYTGQAASWTALVTRAYNTGCMTPFIKGAWLANSKTVDRSINLANDLTETGTVTEAVVETSAELKGYSGWSTSNYLNRASDADWDAIGTGSAYLSCWFKSSASGFELLTGFGNSGATLMFNLAFDSGGTIRFKDDGATAAVQTSSGTVCDDGVWHKADFVRVSSTERYGYIDGVLEVSTTTDAGSLSSSGNLPFAIGIDPKNNSSDPATSTTLSLVRLSTTAPTATEIRQMYDAEKGMFVASAECLLQSGSTDAVLDVDVDPLTGKVLVTQTDAITIFDGMVVDSKPTVNSGNSEKGKLWGNLRTEQNSANAYVTAPAVDQRQVNEMVRGLASDLPTGLDLSKAKAWVIIDGTGTIDLDYSYNVLSVTDGGTGYYDVFFSVKFKYSKYVVVGSANFGNVVSIHDSNQTKTHKALIKTFDTDGNAADADPVSVIFFGELENE